MLTNGRAFAKSEIVAAWAGIQHPDLAVAYRSMQRWIAFTTTWCKRQGAFDETVLGVLKLKDKGQKVEIRVVLHAITAPGSSRLVSGLRATFRLWTTSH